MEHLIEPEEFVGMRGVVSPLLDDEDILHEFEGRCIGTRHGLLKVCDADDDVFEVEVSQFTSNK